MLGGNDRDCYTSGRFRICNTVTLRDGSVSSKTVTPAPPTATPWIWKSPQRGGTDWIPDFAGMMDGDASAGMTGQERMLHFGLSLLYTSDAADDLLCVDLGG